MECKHKETIRRKKFGIKNEEIDLTPDIQTLFTDTKATTKPLKMDEKMTVFKILTDLGFYDSRPKTEGNISPGMKDVKIDLTKATDKFLNPPSALPHFENEEESDDLHGEGMKRNVPFVIFDIHTKLEVLLGLKLSGHTNTVTEA